VLEEFLGRPKVAAAMAVDWVICTIDVDRMTHGKEIDERMMHGRSGGLPWLAILDADGVELISSNDPKHGDGNIGAPAQPDEIDHFLVMLRTTKQHAIAADLATIEQELREFAKPYQRPPAPPPAKPPAKPAEGNGGG
jgi:hypothetical protein